MIYFFDTNIILAYVRQSAVADKVDQVLDLTDKNQIYISVVSIGELLSIANQSNWGDNKRTALSVLLQEYGQVTVESEELLIRYAEVDAFSQNKLANRPLANSARNMGKNDPWIAASASLSGASLITTDKDFDHLHEQFLDVIWINPDNG